MSPGLLTDLRKLRKLAPLGALVLVLAALYALGSFAAGLAIGPQKAWQGDIPASRFGLSPDTVHFTTPDGIPITAWYERPWRVSRPRGTVVLIHGPQGNKSSMALFGSLMLQQGFNVLIPDLRAHGASGGKYVTFGYAEAADVLAAIAWARERSEVPLVLFGYSSGAVTGLYAAAQSPDVAAVIADSAFLRIGDVLARESVFLGSHSRTAQELPWQYRVRLWMFTRPVLGSLARWVYRVKAGEPFEPPDGGVLAAVKKIRRPAVLYLSAEGDPVVPAGDVKRLFEATASADKQLVFQPGNNHSAFLGDRRRYLETIGRFLGRAVERPAQ